LLFLYFFVSLIGFDFPREGRFNFFFLFFFLQALECALRLALLICSLYFENFFTKLATPSQKFSDLRKSVKNKPIEDFLKLDFFKSAIKYKVDILFLEII
jgi:hypothetical protein